MIINESERNRIKSLYGLITEDTPPSESVLVAKKNPFKYPEYESARRMYSVDLKDNDLFYLITSMYTFFQELEKQKIIDPLIGKTMKIVDSDVILTITNVYVDPKDNLEVNVDGNPSSRVKKIIITPNDVVLKDTYGEITDSQITTKYLPKLNNFIEHSRKLVNSYRQDVNKFTTFSKDPKLVDQSYIENIPDKFFEIRKIQRQETDF